MDGILVVDKPAGPTSHDVVDSVRRAFKMKKVGHTGTLDPVATGVLPLVLGKATKLARYLSGGDKTYRAVVVLGKTTSTLDAEGEVTAENAVDVSEEQVRETLSRFVGEIQQIPPMYSAKKIGGKRLYELARNGVEVAREPKTVEVHRLELEEQNIPFLTIEVTCSAGTYVRVLAQDIGAALGCGAHLGKLTRLRAGPFQLEDAVSLQTIENDPAAAREQVLPIRHALSEAARINVPSHVAKLVATGRQLTVADLRLLDIPEFNVDEVVALWLDNGELLAVTRALIRSSDVASARRDEQALKTERVLTSA